jgi:Nitrate and nitrite sensing
VALAQAEEAASFQRGLGAVVTRFGGFQGRDQQLLAAAMGARQHELVHFLATATPGQRDRCQRAVGAPRVEHADELEALLLGAGRNPTGQVSPDDWLLAATERVDALRAVAGWLGTQAVAANRAAIASASGRQLANALVLLVAVLSSVALASFLARSMVRPLLLEQAAMDVAERKLPGVVDRLHRGASRSTSTPKRSRSTWRRPARSAAWRRPSRPCSGWRSTWRSTRRRCAGASARCSSTWRAAARA